jgi:hypothetical protein
MLRGSRPDAYETEVVEVGEGGARAACLRAVGDPGDGFGTLMQMVAADDYREKRLRFRARVRGESVEKWSGLWMRVDGPGDQSLAFDNMEDRALRGSFDWTAAEVVLDAPAESEAVAFGLVLVGGGAAWLTHVLFETVTQEVAITGGPRNRHLSRQPQNLDFSG